MSAVRSLEGGFKYMVNSIGALMVVRFTEVVRFWEGPVSLYMLLFFFGIPIYIPFS